MTRDSHVLNLQQMPLTCVCVLVSMGDGKRRVCVCVCARRQQCPIVAPPTVHFEQLKPKYIFFFVCTYRCCCKTALWFASGSPSPLSASLLWPCAATGVRVEERLPR